MVMAHQTLGMTSATCDTTGIAQTYLLILMGGFSTHSDPNVMAPHHSNDGSAYKDLCLLTTSDDAGQLGFYTAIMREHNILCRRMSCWKTICDPTLPEGQEKSHRHYRSTEE